MKYFNKVRIDGELKSMVVKDAVSKKNKPYKVTEFIIATETDEGEVLHKGTMMGPHDLLDNGTNVTALGVVKGIYNDYDSGIQWQAVTAVLGK